MRDAVAHNFCLSPFGPVVPCAQATPHARAGLSPFAPTEANSEALFYLSRPTRRCGKTAFGLSTSEASWQWSRGRTSAAQILSRLID